MRGKKKDPDFLSDFIAECAVNGIDTADKIVMHAKKTIDEIEDQIKQVDKLRIRRSKLLDVVEVFQVTQRPNRDNEIKTIAFLKMQHPQICKLICQTISENGCNINQLFTKEDKLNVAFTIKQLLLHKIVVKVGDLLVRGEGFDAYFEFLTKGHLS